MEVELPVVKFQFRLVVVVFDSSLAYLPALNIKVSQMELNAVR